ncbi:MAG: hypothetical protein KIT02_06910 [Devosia sp.]|uniref:hypothetical protein n=1 Tax=Devosia sp. TaxID=1871048 RepID=UPI0024CC2C5E|nr:hypothetical protein [Devosia sp.]UYO00925.1 MAG: hypothetical protein KIT02_06910 [Devosia sp.]
MPQTKMPTPVLLALTVGPAILIGATLWVVGDLVPACTVTEDSRQTSPDGQFDLVTFSRDCGDTPANIQAALVPPDEEVPFDAASFVSVAAMADLAPRWDGYGNIEITLPQGAEILRQDDAVAGITVIYR